MLAHAVQHRSVSQSQMQKGWSSTCTRRLLRRLTDPAKPYDTMLALQPPLPSFSPHVVGGCVASLQGRMFTSHDTTATMDRFVKFYFLQQFGYAGAGVAPCSPNTFPWLSPGCHPQGISTFMASSRLCTDTNRPTVACACSVSWHECFRTRSACGSVCLCMTSPHGVASSQVLPTVACRLLEPSAQYVPCLPVGHSQSAPVCYD